MTRKPRLVWTTRALADLDAIDDHIAQDDPVAAERWVLRLFATAEKVVRFPLAGRRVPELHRDDVREVFLRTYRIVYLVSASAVKILTVFEGRRLLGADILDDE